jgi:hypothetical protein
MPSPGQLVPALLATVLAVPLLAQQPKPAPEPAQQLARDVIWNELHDRGELSHWSYISTRITGGQTLLREQVETSDGPVSRVLERNGTPLDAVEQQREVRRIDAYIHDPSAIARKQRDLQQDEARLASIMQIIPQAFLFEYQGAPSGDIVRLSFRPNPAFVPSGYDARILHALAGTMTVNLCQKRMVDMQGAISQPVDIGYGLLGSVNSGSTFEIHRCQVTPAHWMTDLMDVHVRGRLLMLRNLSKDQREARSNFHRVPENTTLAQAKSLLSHAAMQRSLQAQLVGSAGSQQTAAVASNGVSSDP